MTYTILVLLGITTIQVHVSNLSLMDPAEDLFLIHFTGVAFIAIPFYHQVEIVHMVDLENDFHIVTKISFFRSYGNRHFYA